MTSNGNTKKCSSPAKQKGLDRPELEEEIRGILDDYDERRNIAALDGMDEELRQTEKIVVWKLADLLSPITTNTTGLDRPELKEEISKRFTWVIQDAISPKEAIDQILAFIPNIEELQAKLNKTQTKLMNFGMNYKKMLEKAKKQDREREP